VPRSERRISRAVRELTGFHESLLGGALREEEAWQRLCEASTSLGALPVPTVIHFARFELTFLRDLHARLSPEQPFPLDVVCLHEVASRLLPELPRRNIRALAGHLGHSLELQRAASGHVHATAFIWRALLPMLNERAIDTWDQLASWLSNTARPARPTRRSFPLAAERRRALPDRPGVYRFVRRNGDVLYVGKAASLKARVASHFAGHARATERSLEMLTQVADIDYSETPSVLEAALLECDEIKRLDPPYNVHLRATERSTFFAARDLTEVSALFDPAHPHGPLPSRFSVAPLAALIALLAGAPPSTPTSARALGVPLAFAPDESLFHEGLALFLAEHLAHLHGSARERIERASRALWLARGLREPDVSNEDAPPDAWDLARVRRRLERNLVQAGLVLRRARYLCLLADADVAYRESKMAHGRVLSLSMGSLSERRTLPPELSLVDVPVRKASALAERKSQLDIAAYDRLRVLLTELRRVREEGGAVTLRIGGHTFSNERFARLTREV
jgi:DNA polymerase-3 subunit epsilon